MKGLGLFGVLVAVGLAIQLPERGTSAETPVGAIEGERVIVKLCALGTVNGGSTGEVGNGAAVLNLGETKAVHVAISPPAADRSMGFSMSLTSGEQRPIGEALAERGKHDDAHLWWAEATLVSATIERIELDVEWSRFDRTGEGELRLAHRDRRRIVLREGERHVLDFVDSGPLLDTAYAYRNVSVEISASIQEDPRFVKRLFKYEFWLVDEGPHGRTVRRAESVGTQGERVAVTLPELRWPAVARFGTGRPAEVLGVFDVAVRGRQHDDGSIDVAFSGGRFVSVVPEGQPVHGGEGSGGSKRVRVRPSEAVRLVVPLPTGAMTNWDGESDLGSLDELRREPQSVRGTRAAHGLVEIDFPRFFAGHTMSIILRATPL